MRWLRRIPLSLKFAALALAYMAAAAALSMVLREWLQSWAAAGLSVALL